MNIKNGKPDKVSLSSSTCITVVDAELIYVLTEIRT